MTACRTCGSPASKLQSGVVLEHSVDYFECAACGYVQTEQPHWLGQAYESAINDSDTGILSRNQANARITLATMFLLGTLRGKLVDCAGGYGILVRLLRDAGVDAWWSDRYCQNLVARGFEHGTGTADVVTSFEAFEHFTDPSAELDRMLAIAPNVLLSTEIIASPAPKPGEWWYYGQEHGQHIGFFRVRTLEKLAKERGKYLLTNGASYHLISDRPVNQTAWRLLIRANMLVPLLLRRKLQSKTWSDHQLVGRQKNDAHRA